MKKWQNLWSFTVALQYINLSTGSMEAVNVQKYTFLYESERNIFVLKVSVSLNNVPRIGGRRLTRFKGHGLFNFPRRYGSRTM